MLNITQIPAPRVPLIDARTGLMTTQWFRYFNNINTVAGGGTGLIAIENGGTGEGTIPAVGQILIGTGTAYALKTMAAGHGLTYTNGTTTVTFSLDVTGVIAGTYGTASAVPTYTVNAEGQLTASANTPIAITGSQVISGTVPSATYVAGGAANRILYQTGPGVTSFIAAPTSAGDGLTWTGSAFAWAPGGGGSGTVTSVSGTGTVSGLTLSGTVTTSGSLTLGGTLDLSSPPVIGASVPNSATFTSAALTSGTITTVPSNGTDIVNKSYVDLIAGSGIHIHTPVLVETPSALTATYTNGGTTPTWTTITTNREIATGSAHGLSVGAVIVFGSTTNGLTAGTPYFVYSVPTTTSITLSLTYNGAQITSLTNGTGLSITSRANAGVGATLTNSGTLAAINIDNVALTIGDRVLVYRQASAFQNGIYTVTTVGSGAVAWVLTRASDTNTYSPNSTSSLGEGDYFFVQSGDTGKGESYVLTTGGTLIFGTTNLTFTQFSDSAVYSAGTGLTLSGTAFSITPAGTAGTYGSASSVPVITTNASGQVSSVTNTPIAILGSAVSGDISGNAANITGTYAGTLNSSQITTGLGFTPYNATNPAGYTANTGTVTSVAALTLGTTGTDLSSTVATGTTTPVITLQVPTASATNRGALSAADWSTFNDKQAALGYTPVNKAGDTMTGALNLVAGTASVAPLDFQTGTNLTTASAGSMEFDGTVPYFSIAASTRGAIPTEQWVILTGTNTLTSQTAVQPIFDGGGGPAGGAVTLPVGTYQFECQFALTGMSATSGSFGFGLAGTATKTFSYRSDSSKAGTALTTSMATLSLFATAANTALQTATTGTVGTALIKGIMRVTVTGTVIPQVSLTVAAAAVVQTNSYFRVSPIGSATVATLGNWS